MALPRRWWTGRRPGYQLVRLNFLISARVENNVDYWGADIRSFRSRGLRDCYNACRRQGGCRSFTMRKRDHWCWLKRRHNGARRMTNRRHLISANLVMRRSRTRSGKRALIFWICQTTSLPKIFAVHRFRFQYFLYECLLYFFQLRLNMYLLMIEKYMYSIGIWPCWMASC